MKILTNIAIPALVLFLLSGAQGATITIAHDPTADQGNFGTPGTTARIGYTIDASDDGTNFNVLLNSLPSTDTDVAQPFANLYFDTIASTPGTGSNLGFEFGPSSQDAFIPGGAGGFSIASSGITSTFTTNMDGTISAAVVIPNEFFLTDPNGIGFAKTPDGTLVSLHLSQSFGYSVVGGGANYAAPTELGAGVVSSAAATPEPGSITLLGIGVCGLVSLRRKFFGA